MIRAKNYKTVTKFVKVMPRILWPLFFLDMVYIVHRAVKHFFSYHTVAHCMHSLQIPAFERCMVAPAVTVTWPYYIVTTLL